MKATTYFSRLMLIAAAALILGSCDDNFGSGKVPFQIIGKYAYMVQRQSGDITTFTPFIGFSTYAYSSGLVSGSVMRGTTPLGANVYYNVSVETSLAENSTQDLTSLNGTYDLSATDADPKSCYDDFQVTFTANDAMDLGDGVEELQYEDFTYTGQTIRATISEVGNATHYLFLIVPVLDDTPVNGPEIKTLVLHSIGDPVLKTSNPKQTVPQLFNNSYQDSWIYPAAARTKNNGIVMIIGKGKFLPKGATSFAADE